VALAVTLWGSQRADFAVSAASCRRIKGMFAASVNEITDRLHDEFWIVQMPMAAKASARP